MPLDQFQVFLFQKVAESQHSPGCLGQSLCGHFTFVGTHLFFQMGMHLCIDVTLQNFSLFVGEGSRQGFICAPLAVLEHAL